VAEACVLEVRVLSGSTCEGKGQRRRKKCEEGELGFRLLTTSKLNLWRSLGEALQNCHKGWTFKLFPLATMVTSNNHRSIKSLEIIFILQR
jgi:hypothetical protein